MSRADPPRDEQRATWSPETSRHVVVYDGDDRPWRVLDVARSRGNAEVASWHRPPQPTATGRAFIAAERTSGAKIVRVLDRHPADPWDDLRPATLREQLGRAYLPPLGWVERHGGTGVGWRRDRGARRESG